MAKAPAIPSGRVYVVGHEGLAATVPGQVGEPVTLELQLSDWGSKRTRIGLDTPSFESASRELLITRDFAVAREFARTAGVYVPVEPAESLYVVEIPAKRALKTHVTDRPDGAAEGQPLRFDEPGDVYVAVRWPRVAVRFEDKWRWTQVTSPILFIRVSDGAPPTTAATEPTTMPGN